MMLQVQLGSSPYTNLIYDLSKQDQDFHDIGESDYVKLWILVQAKMMEVDGLGSGSSTQQQRYEENKKHYQYAWKI